MKLSGTALAASLAAFSALLLVSACDSGGTEAPSSQPESVEPTPFAASATGPAPAGYHLEQCPDLRAEDGSGLALRLLVPDDYGTSYREGRGCSFATDDERSLSVSMGVGQSLADFRDESVAPFEGDGGDDGLTGVTYETDVPVFGDRRGERLGYEPFNDGLRLSVRVLQADGVRLQWAVAAGQAEAEADALAVVAASVAVVEDDHATCRGRGLTARYVPPLPQTETVESGGGRCYLYLRPRESLQRYAEVVVSPRGSLAEQAERLRGARSVSGIVLEPGAARLDGAPADRLTWVVTLTKPRFGSGPGTWRNVAVGNDSARVTWAATPQEWVEDQASYAAFLASLDIPAAAGRQ